MQGRRPPALGGSGAVPGGRTRLTRSVDPSPRPWVHESGMRAPVQKTRPRRTGKQAASGSPERRGTVRRAPAAGSAGRGTPPAHVRTRLIVAVAVVAAAVAGAGAPSVLTASRQLSDSQELVTLAEQHPGGAHARPLARRRTRRGHRLHRRRPAQGQGAHRAAQRPGRPAGRGAARGHGHTRRAPRGPRHHRRRAQGGPDRQELRPRGAPGVLRDHHRPAPPRRGPGRPAAAPRGLRRRRARRTRHRRPAGRRDPRAAARRAERADDHPDRHRPRHRSADHDGAPPRPPAPSSATHSAPPPSRPGSAPTRPSPTSRRPRLGRPSRRYDSTVTGPEVDTADEVPRRPHRPAEPRRHRTRHQHRQGRRARCPPGSTRCAAPRPPSTTTASRTSPGCATTTSPRWRSAIAVLGALLLLAVGITTAMARTLTRPLSVLRRGSARLAGAENPGAEEPVTFTGRNDEFAQVVRSVNALHAHAAALARAAHHPGGRPQAPGRPAPADGRRARAAPAPNSPTAAAHLERSRSTIHGTFVNLALRTLGPGRAATRGHRGPGGARAGPGAARPPSSSSTTSPPSCAGTARTSSSSPAPSTSSSHAGPVPLVDVVRAAVSEIERYERVRIAALPPHAHLAGFAADDLSHLVAELLENATSFSPPDVPVEVSGWLLESGEVMLSVQDEGIGMTADRLARLNARLADFTPRPRTTPTDPPTRRAGRRGARARPVRGGPARPPARRPGAVARAEAGRGRRGRRAAEEPAGPRAVRGRPDGVAGAGRRRYASPSPCRARTPRPTPTSSAAVRTGRGPAGRAPRRTPYGTRGRARTANPPGGPPQRPRPSTTHRTRLRPGVRADGDHDGALLPDRPRRPDQPTRRPARPRRPDTRPAEAVPPPVTAARRDPAGRRDRRPAPPRPCGGRSDRARTGHATEAATEPTTDASARPTDSLERARSPTRASPSAPRRSPPRRPPRAHAAGRRRRRGPAPPARRLPPGGGSRLSRSRGGDRRGDGTAPGTRRGNRRNRTSRGSHGGHRRGGKQLTAPSTFGLSLRPAICTGC